MGKKNLDKMRALNGVWEEKKRLYPDELEGTSIPTHMDQHRQEQGLKACSDPVHVVGPKTRILRFWVE